MNSFTLVHSCVLWIHIAAGPIALTSGTIAATVRKGSAMHGGAGTWFCISMLVLGLTAAFLEPFRPVPGSPIGGLLVCYFVLSGWMTARRRGDLPGRIEKIGCAAAFGGAGFMAWSGYTGIGATAGSGPAFALAGICLLAGLLDLNAILRRLTAAQRMARHLWRMCFAFFIATGSFFLGQQQVLPGPVQGSPILFVLALAPFALMLFWLVRLRLPRTLSKLRLRPPDTVVGGAG